MIADINGIKHGTWAPHRLGTERPGHVSCESIEAALATRAVKFGMPNPGAESER